MRTELSCICLVWSIVQRSNTGLKEGKLNVLTDEAKIHQPSHIEEVALMPLVTYSEGE